MIINFGMLRRFCCAYIETILAKWFNWEAGLTNFGVRWSQSSKFWLLVKPGLPIFGVIVKIYGVYDASREYKPGGFFPCKPGLTGLTAAKPGYPGLAYAVPDGGVNSAKISSVDLQHIKLAPAVQCMHQYILRLCYRQPIDWSIAIATKKCRLNWIFVQILN